MFRININSMDLPRCFKMDRQLINGFKRAARDQFTNDRPKIKTPLSELRGGVGGNKLTEQQIKNIREARRKKQADQLVEQMKMQIEWERAQAAKKAKAAS